jgi:hypothetical protein
MARWRRNGGCPKVLIDNSAAVEGFEEAKSYDQKQEELLDNINVLYVV